MRNLLFTTAALYAIWATAAQAADNPANPLVGSWRLVAAIPASMEDSDPGGIRNLRVRFGADGKAVLVDPSEILSESKARNGYTVGGNSLTLQMGEGGDLHAAVAVTGDVATIRYRETGMAWTLVRIADAEIEKQRLAPESVEYFPPATADEVQAFHYDEGGAGSDLVGQWEVIEISGYGAGDFPPYGAPNDVWQFDGKRIKRVGRSDPKAEPGYRDYEVKGPLLVMRVDSDEFSQPMSFDRWGRLVIGDPKDQHTVLKRINHDGTGKTVLPPLRIVLDQPAN